MCVAVIDFWKWGKEICVRYYVIHHNEPCPFPATTLKEEHHTKNPKVVSPEPVL